MTSTLDRPDREPATAAYDSTGTSGDPKRFRALGVIAVAQLMVVLDASVVIIALPSAQRALHISTANRQWMLTAYTLAFAGLLLLGGRIADYFGRKRMFIVGLLGFAAASALGGLAQNSAMLFSARALQGAFAAVMAPAALSLLTVAFTEPKERARAFAVYGGISGGGAAIGLILGGALTAVRLMALDAADQRALRHPRGGGRDGGGQGEPQPGQPRLRPARCGDRHRRPGRPRLRLHQGRYRRLELVDGRGVVRRRRRAAGLVRGDRAPGPAPAPPHARRVAP